VIKGEIWLILKEYMGPAYLTIAASIWGGMYVVSKVVLDIVPPLELVWLRYLVALAALILVGLVTGQSWQIKKRDIPLLVGIGIIGYFFSIWAQFFGTKYSSAQMGAVVTSATPAFMVIFAYAILKEKITTKKLIAVLLATIGVLFVVGIGDVDKDFQLGGIALVFAALSWALMSVLIKKVPKEYSQLVVTTYAILSATIVITPFSISQFKYEELYLLLQPTIILGVLYIGVAATAIAFLFWNKGMQLVDASRGGVYFFFQPLVGTFLGWFFLDEQIGFGFCVGAFLILSGVLLAIKAEN